MSINSLLVKFASQDLVLARSSSERQRIDNSLNALESKLKSGLNQDINRFIRFGSYTRNTILPRRYDENSDVDLMVIMKGGNSYSPNTYRNWIKDVLIRTYPNSISKKDFPVVKLELNHIMFDIVPAYSTQHYFGKERFFIPDKNSNWKETFPNDINKGLSDANQSVGDNTVRNVIRLCKHWNASKKYLYESYEMEKLIIDYCSYTTGNTYSVFLETMDYIAGRNPGVSQALSNIRYYKGDIWGRPADPEKQVLWLRKLLPAL